MGYYLIYFGLAYLLSWILISPLQTLAQHYEMRQETGKTKTGIRKRIPLLGGVAIYFGFVLTLLVYSFWPVDEAELKIVFQYNKLLAIVAGSALVCLAGFVHDIYPSTSLARVVIHVLAAFLLVLSGIRPESSLFQIVPIEMGRFAFSLGQLGVTILWVLLLVYLFDMMEKLEGLTSGIAFLISVFLFTIGILGNNPSTAFLSFVFAGSVAGLFWDRLFPAKIALGKTGSSFIGFMLAAITLDLNCSQTHFPGFFIPLLLLAVPLAFALFFTARKIAKKPLSIEAFLVAMANHKVERREMLNFGLIVTALSGFASLLIFHVANQTLSLFLIAGIVIANGLLIAKVFQSIGDEKTASSK